MNTNTKIIGGVLAALLVGGLIVYAATNKPTAEQPTATTTPPVVTQPRQAGVPVLTPSSVSIPTDTTVVLTGKVNPSGTFTNYWYEYGITANLGSKTATQSVGSGFVSLSSPGYVTGLTKDTTYFFRLVAENQYGKVAGPQYSFKTTSGTPPPVGSVPTTKTLSANSISRNTASLNGEIVPNKAETTYWFEYGRTPNLGNTSALVAIGNGTAKVTGSLALTDLDPATTYYFRVNAQNQFGTVNGDILNFKTQGPPAGVSPSADTRSAIDISTSTATLRGTINPNGAETTYWFEYSTDSLLGSALLNSTEHRSASSGTANVSIEADISGLSQNTTYFVRVVAQNNFDVVRGDRISFKTK